MRDTYGNWIVSKEYKAAMLTEALCKLEGFVYAPSESVYWQHGRATEYDFIYITAQKLSRDQLAGLSAEVGDGRSLLVYQSHGQEDSQRSAWGRDDYSLQVPSLPPPEPGPTEPVPNPRRAEQSVDALPLFNRP